MGRIGISYEQVARAANSLRDKGINVTVDNVRNVLGTGSKSTIVPLLRKWKEPYLTKEDVKYDYYYSLIQSVKKEIRELLNL